MKISETGKHFIAGFEGFEPTPYRDQAGYLTIGFGHRIKTGELFSSVTEEEAETLLGQDLLWAETVVSQHVDVDLNQNQFDALVSFVFNVGAGAKGFKDGFVILADGQPSTMLRLLNNFQYEQAAAQFPMWCYAGGEKIDGLLQRREAEKALFLSPVSA